MKILIIQKECQISSTIISKIKHKNNTHKNYTGYLTNENPNSFLISPTDKEEIKFILSSIDVSKSTGPDIIPTKVLNMLTNDISEQLADLFNISFTTGTFPTFNNCLSNPYKLLIIRSRLSSFLNIEDIIYPVRFGFCQIYSTTFGDI